MIDCAPAIRATCPHLTAAEVAAWAAAFNAQMPRFGITTPARVAGMIGQCVVESGGFCELVEDLNYSAAGLRATFPHEFPTMAIALQYARQPPRIGARAYANRMGNGAEASGDGWTFRGLGPMQTTGRADISLAASVYGLTPDALADAAQQPGGGAKLACWDWQHMGSDAFADREDWYGLSVRVNGGTDALADRVAMCEAALKALGGASAASSAPPPAHVVAHAATSAPPDQADALNAKVLAGLQNG